MPLTGPPPPGRLAGSAGRLTVMGWLSRNRRPSVAATTSDGAERPSLAEGPPPGPERPTSESPAPEPGTAPEAPAENAAPTAPMGAYGPLVRISRFDTAPDELEWQLPLDGELYRLLPGPDRPDYSVVLLERPLHFYPEPALDLARVPADQQVEDRKGRRMVRVDAVLVCARFVGQQLHPGMVDLPVNVAHVLDNALVREDAVDFAKISFAAVGYLSEGRGEPAAVSEPGHSLQPDEPDERDDPDEPDEPDQLGAEPDGVHTVPPPADGVVGQGVPPSIVLDEVLPALAGALRSGVQRQRDSEIRVLTATLTLDEDHRIVGLTGNADGTPPVPTADTFAELAQILDRLGDLPERDAVRALTIRLDGDHLDSDVDYRHH